MRTAASIPAPTQRATPRALATPFIGARAYAITRTPAASAVPGKKLVRIARPAAAPISHRWGGTRNSASKGRDSFEANHGTPAKNTRTGMRPSETPHSTALDRP
jgi:hypothetical protein